MPSDQWGNVTSSGRGMAGLAAIWALGVQLVTVRLPTLFAALRRLAG